MEFQPIYVELSPLYVELITQYVALSPLYVELIAPADGAEAKGTARLATAHLVAGQQALDLLFKFDHGALIKARLGGSGLLTATGIAYGIVAFDDALLAQMRNGYGLAMQV